MSKNPVIIFEGIEASGKSTNLDLAAKYLKKKRKKYIKLREPGGSPFSEKIRKILLNKNYNLDYKTDLMLFLASRSENFQKIIKKNFNKRVILIDRFIDSTIAYQHYGMNINLKTIKTLNKLGKYNFSSFLSDKALLKQKVFVIELIDIFAQRFWKTTCCGSNA